MPETFRNIAWPEYAICKDPALQQQLARDGYATLEWMDAEALMALRQLYEEIRPQVQLSGFATTTTSPNLELKRHIADRVAAVYAAQVEAHFAGIKCLGASFLHKESGQAGDLPLHQDWTVTDEDHFRTLTIWMPLEDCLEENGALQMLPGSHRCMNLLRGPNLPVAIREIGPALEDRLVTLPLRAGQAVIFDHALLHRSLRNTSGRPRIAVTFGLTAQDSPLRFWYHHPGDAATRFEQLAVPDDFFLRYHEIGQRPPLGQSLGYYDHDLRPLDAALAPELGHGRQLYRPISHILHPPACLNLSAQPAITRHADWNAALEEQGYITFPLLSPDQVAGLQETFAAAQTQVDRFYASVHSPDIAFRQRMDAAIQAVLQPLLPTVLDQAVGLGAAFIAKPQGAGGILPPHADWNIVDERHHRSYNLWIPLVDTTVANGAVHIIPGSHRWLDYYRGPGIPNPFAPHQDLIWEAMQPLELPAGTALLYDHRLLHASPVNTTTELRLACVMGVIPSGAPMRYYHGADGIVRAYTATPEFYMLQDPAAGPSDLPFWEEVTHDQPQIDDAQLRGWLGLPPASAILQPEPESLTPDRRTFRETYTLRNMLSEMRHRVTRLRGRMGF